MFLDVLDQHAALKEKRVKQPKQPERITDAYHIAMVKQAKSEYFKSHIENNAHDSKTMWNYLLVLATHFILRHHSSVSFEGTTVSESKDVSSTFNKHFVSITGNMT